MPLFQKSVLNKYIKDINQEALEEAWKGFKKHFHDPKVQENIRSHNEEQYQAKFLIDLFVNILGYTLNPDPDFNLITEQKNEKDSKKADGAILQDENVIGVIELKGTNTRDLNKIKDQAFSYKNNQASCAYVVTSNFEKLRFYINDAIEFEEFNLFSLSKERFAVLWLCLAKKNVFKAIPKKIKEQSLTQEEAITKQLYKDYAQFRNEVFDDIQKRNPSYDKLTLFNKTQKLLDRLLFIFFAEDKGLLPANAIRTICTEWQELNERFGKEESLYERFKVHFNYLNTGFKSKQYEIFAYNGGLFREDEVLNEIQIDDKLLHKHTVKLSDYDFDSEVSVNILGHIFEHSLNDIEQIQNDLLGIKIKKNRTKRRRDGVFYTPKYITKYIVENTLGKLCKEKKEELKLLEEDYKKGRKGRKTTTISKLTKNLTNYRNWLLQLTICDPACGSGAFLNQALDFLIDEHNYLDELRENLLGGSIIYPNVENIILENNLYGVDINDEGVEIAKLSLWLRTAKEGRRLTSLNNNIKCGNSLIADKDVAGNKVFHWEREFPEVFEKGGFDVVIGNPPYNYRNSGNKTEKKYFNDIYKSAEGNFELYKFFVEKGINLLGKSGVFSFITSSSFLIQKSFTKLRKLILDETKIVELIPLGPGVFEDATVDTAICVLSKNRNTSNYVSIKIPTNPLELDTAEKNEINTDRYRKNKGYVFDCQLTEDMFILLDKVLSNSERLEELFDIGVGINTGYIRDKLVSIKKLDERYHPMVTGSGISRYGLCRSDEWIMYDKEYVTSQGKLGRTLPDKEYFDNDKLLIVRTRNLSMPIRIVATFDGDKKYNLNRLSNIISKNNNSLFGLLGFLNSSFYNWLFSTKYLDYEIKPVYLRECPIVASGLKSLELPVRKVYDLTIRFETVRNTFSTYLKESLAVKKLNKKLRFWNELQFAGFLNELNKVLKKDGREKLVKQQELEWMEVFQAEKAKALEIKSQIDQTDKEIDQMVYELYELTPEEIEIVEGG